MIGRLFKNHTLLMVICCLAMPLAALSAVFLL